MLSGLNKDAARQLNQRSTIPCSVFVIAVALHSKFSLFSKFSRSAGSICRRRLRMFCRHRESIRQISVETLWGSLRENGADGRLLTLEP